MFAIATITSTLAAMAIMAMIANPRPDHPCRIVGRATVRAVVSYGICIARMRYPDQFISDETRYEAWLESHDESATLPTGGPSVGYGATGV